MREFQRAAVRLHILHHAADDEVHGAWPDGGATHPSNLKCLCRLHHYARHFTPVPRARSARAHGVLSAEPAWCLFHCTCHPSMHGTLAVQVGDRFAVPLLTAQVRSRCTWVVEVNCLDGECQCTKSNHDRHDT